jgi:hypothetical protein
MNVTGSVRTHVHFFDDDKAGNIGSFGGALGMSVEVRL